MKKTVRKLYKGLVEVRDYDIEECIKNNKNFEIIFQEESMILTPEDLVNKRKSISNTFQSKIKNAKNYKLYGYYWNPN